MSPLSREASFARLGEDPFDLLVVGGGATGAGVALDASTRGLSVALVERDDFSAGTSSRSTKLIHGGVRYLEKAVKEFDRSQFNLVRDALRERAVLIRIAPHLARPMPLVTPLYHWVQVPYFRTGLKLYDWLAGKSNLAPSRFVDAKEARARFPMLKAEGLRGGVIYYDGQFDDARMNVAIALTAVEDGAVCVNHAEVTALDKEDGNIAGARVRDRFSGEEVRVRARAVVNATGPFTDAVRRMDDPNARPMLSVSSGIHIVLDQRFSPPDTGLLIPETDDGRVLFLLPWQGHTLVGTTDAPAEIETHPKASDDDIEYVLRHVRRYFASPVTREDVRATFSGLRPLVSDPDSSDTARLSRDHVINVSTGGLVTIAGGKWTTYRRMALDTVDQAIKVGGLSAGPSRTSERVLIGGANHDPDGAAALADRFGLPEDVARHLNGAYGDRAAQVATVAAEEGLSARLAEGHPYLEAEAIHAARHELARSTTDVLMRRTRLGVLDRDAAVAAVARVNELLAAELSWSEARAAEDRADATAYVV
ncbi:MAG: FAD-dependent oxidoreductase [Trueperaceae bacterium]|nr:FAD-dependent oxidoreductase [Trueperaceae bacterium]